MGNDCIYSSSFKTDLDSFILISGCLWETISIQIQSEKYGDIMATVTDGIVQLPTQDTPRIDDGIYQYSGAHNNDTSENNF